MGSGFRGHVSGCHRDRYQVDPAKLRIFELANLHVIKVSFPRNFVAGSFDDRDLHAGQQHVLLAGLSVPVVLRLRVSPSPEENQVEVSRSVRLLR